MIRKNLYLSLILSFTIFSHNHLLANDVADMSGISEAAGESAAAAAVLNLPRELLQINQ